MKRVPLSLSILLLLLAPALRAEIPSAPGPELVIGENDAAWRPLFDALAAQGAVYSSFTEHRWFSVRKEPVVLHGELRHSAERGLSLRYVKPEEQVLVVDAQGLLMRNAQGRTRTMAADPRAPRIDAALLPVLRFDLPALLKLFSLRAARDGDDWRLDFTPRTPELARTLSTLTVEGSGEAVRRLEFRRSAKQRVEVLIGETRTGVTFSADEVKRFFR
ncbi:MAG TPA: outer membrane lipoprotein carrier protein LolA [Opitutaceae bacterium]|nr:outer membrane lipoprotein carrier protein LolA [Opitutaceae bacterium]